MSREADRIEALRDDLVRAVVEATGMRETMAMPIANSLLTMLQDRYGGSKLYIPAPGRQYDLLQIQAALERGTSVSRVCTEHGISRSKLYELFPGGVPAPRQKPA